MATLLQQPPLRGRFPLLDGRELPVDVADAFSITGLNALDSQGFLLLGAMALHLKRVERLLSALIVVDKLSLLCCLFFVDQPVDACALLGVNVLNLTALTGADRVTVRSATLQLFWTVLSRLRIPRRATTSGLRR